jgi:hypothetical protein
LIQGIAAIGGRKGLGSCALALLSGLPSPSAGAQESMAQPTFGMACAAMEGTAGEFDWKHAPSHGVNRLPWLGHRAENGLQGYSMEFSDRGLVLAPQRGSWTWGLRLRTYGRGQETALAAVSEHVRCDADRLECTWGPTVSEWFHNGAAGLEHGFTIRSPVPGGCATDVQAPWTLQLTVLGDLQPRELPDGTGVLFTSPTGAAALSYAGLHAFDATGRELPSRMSVSGEVLSVHVDDDAAVYPLTIDPVVQLAYIKALHALPQVGFGGSVSASGDRVAIGAPGEDSSHAGVNAGVPDKDGLDSGAVYVFRRVQGLWIQEAYIKASNPDEKDFFGRSVSLDGDLLVVGAHAEDSKATGVDGDQDDDSASFAGAAYVFVHEGGTWTQQAYLKASNAEAGDQFGWSVAASGERVVVGAFAEQSSATGVNGDQANNDAEFAGAAYVFVRNGSVWTQEAYLKATDTHYGDHFGKAVALDGERAAIGVPRKYVNGWSAGAVFVFRRSDPGWSQEAYLVDPAVGPSLVSHDEFGQAVSIRGLDLIVGAPLQSSAATGVGGDIFDTSASVSGAAYAYHRTGADWDLEAFLKATNTEAGDNMGCSVAVSGDSAIVGAWREDGSAVGVDGDDQDNGAVEAGAAYVYRRVAGVWTPGSYVKAFNTDAEDHFGSSVSISGSLAFVGAPSEDGGSWGGLVDPGNSNSGTNSGAVEVFDLHFPSLVFCAQSKPSSVSACAVALEVSSPELQVGEWRATGIPRHAAWPPGPTAAVFLFTRGPGLGQSTFSSTVPAGVLCLDGFARASPPCAPTVAWTEPGICNPGPLTLGPDCIADGLGISVGDDVNVQLWYRDPIPDVPGGAGFSNAVYYTAQ